ncbi:hypothetical protein MMIN_15860 [Mycolicibacter minnesotensis]|nr:hypothetical protein MMIN_15860 [Mycolicibacter minnesotensis]
MATTTEPSRSRWQIGALTGAALAESAIATRACPRMQALRIRSADVGTIAAVVVAIDHLSK